MLILADRTARVYHIAINNASTSAELVSDLSYLQHVSRGTLIFDFSHMVAPLSQEKRDEYRPGSFGYQPTLNLMEVTATIIEYMGRYAIRPHEISAILPSGRSRVGRFLRGMELHGLLSSLGLNLIETEPPTAELGEDDASRQNLIPITNVAITKGKLDFLAVMKVRQRIKGAFQKALGNNSELAEVFTTVVSEAVDNMVDYGGGGLIGGLYYPRAGEVEVTLVNRYGGFGGASPDEELEALLSAYEGTSKRNAGGGNGIIALSELAEACFGTVLFRNGSATLRLTPDGSLSGMTSETGFPKAGVYVAIVLQLQPAGDAGDTPAVEEYRAVLASSLENYIYRRNKGYGGAP